MSIANENNRIDITASASQTVFAYDFQIDDETEIAVYQTLAGALADDSTDLLTLTTHYTVDGVGNAGGGNITLVTGAAVNDIIVAVRAVPFSQPDTYNTGEDNAENYENSLDRMAMRIQRLEEELDRAVKFDIAQGALANKIKIDNTVTATETSLWLWDVDGAALVRVTVGADDSGGTGFKNLRIPN